MENVKFFQIVEREWREEYDREWGLGIVMSVDQGDGYVWVVQIDKDDDGYFVAPRAETVHKSRLRETSKEVSDLSISFKEKTDEKS